MGGSILLIATLLAPALLAGAVHAEEEAEPEATGAAGLFEALIGGQPTLDIRARIELADQDTLSASQAYTVRTRLGYGTRPWHGLSVFADFENTAAIAPSQYWDGVEAPTGQTLIADPSATQFNQVYGKFHRADWLNTTAIAGRQRIVLDNSRFVGDVIFRQNEQTYAAGYVDSSFGVDGLKVRYAYIGRVLRIWSGQGGNVGGRYDWGSNSQVVNASYQVLPELRVAAFAYLLEFDDDGATPGTVFNSSATYGVRGSGGVPFAEKWNLGYDLSYAYQADYKNNPLSYSTHYVSADLALARDRIGAVGLGYELLGSDDGMARFVTPLATAHKFNGWADVFLDNGAANGLQDIYASVSPRMPYRFNLKMIYHHFRAAEGGDALGDEINVMLKRALNDYVTASVSAAYFDARSGATKSSVVASGAQTVTTIEDIYRVWFTLEFKF